MHRFHSSIIICDSNDNSELKIGAAPTMCLSQFSIENESYKEKSSLSRTIGAVEDSQCVKKYEMNNDASKKTTIPSMTTPIHESRNKKRNYETLQDEEAKKLASIENDTTHDLKSSCESFSKLNSAW